ncbi:MAG TPA: hypothetical protein VF746_10725 [Longimicrobium sp.]|jgi:hypothetical protein
MRIRTVSPLPVLLAALLAAACAPAAPAGPAPARGANVLQALFDSAITVAAVYRPEHVLPLRPALAGADGRVRVATYTSWSGYRPDSTLTLARDVWVTVVPEVRDSCRTFREDVTLRLEQLLGLPPGAGYDRVAELSVRVEDLFRPAADPAVGTTRPCPDSVSGGCGTSFPPGVAPGHVRWIADATLNLWRIPQGYPWTRLGYTYNWHPGSPRYGASEYVVRTGSTVRVLSVAATAEYCRSGG